MISKTRLLLSAVSLFALSQTAYAQTAAENDGPAQNSDAIVVTASSKAQKIIDAPASISVVTAEELALRPIQDLTDILDRMEGVTINRAGNQRNIQLRGLPSIYTLFLIDGKRVSASTTNFRGNDFDAAWVPVEAIQQVEVVRGPLSSLYGSDAIGGVVNIITKPVGEDWHGSLSADYTFQEDRDAGDLYKVGGYISGPIVAGTLGFKAYGGINIREEDRTVNPVPSGGGDPLPGFDRQEEKYLDGTLVWTPDAHNEVSLNYGYNKLIHGQTPMTRHSGSLAYKGDWDFGNALLRLSADRIHNAAGTVDDEINPNTSNDVILDGRFTLPWEAARQSITIGGEYRYQRLKDPANLGGLPGSPEFGLSTSTSVTQKALFIEDEIEVTEDLSVTLGNRYDDHENFGGHHSPRAYVVWHPVEDLTVKGGWARAFRAPTLLQNSPNWGTVSCGSATTGCYIIGSEDLKPETSTSYEASVRYDTSDFAVGITLFRNSLRNQISIENRTRDVIAAPLLPNFVGFLEDGRPIFAYENIARVRTQGIEATARFSPVAGVTVQANYSYLDAENRSGPTPLAIPYTPHHSGNLSVSWQANEKLSLFAASNYVGRQYLDVYSNPLYNVERGSYLTVDFSGTYKINDKFLIRAGILNVFDNRQEREILTEYNEDGRRFFIAGTAKF